MDILDFIKANGIKGAIFDMDGTLTDSMGRWNEIYSILFDYLGLKFEEEFIMRVNHIPMKQVVDLLASEFELTQDRNCVYEYWLKHTVKFYENIFKIKPYMLEILKELKNAGIKACVATASDGKCAEAFIKSNNLTEYLTSVTSLDEVQRPKSFPDIYFKAAEKLGLEPCECIVFEDALTAIKGAKSGGFKVYGVQDDCSAKDEENIKALCDLTLGFTEKICDKQNTQMIAHRGLSGIYTENTVKAFEEACKRSYYGIECDVHVTKDGKYVIFHDDNTGRLCEEDVVIEQTSFKDLRALNFKDGVSRMPTLEEYLKVAAQHKKTAVIELKNAMPESNIREIIEICKSLYSLEKIIFISFNLENLLTVRKILPKQRIQFLTDCFNDELIEKLTANNFGLDIGWWCLTESIVKLLHKDSVAVNCWTCDDTDNANMLISWGVDFITTNILE